VELLATDIGTDPGIDQGTPVTSVWSGIQLALLTANRAQESSGEHMSHLKAISDSLSLQENSAQKQAKALRTDINSVTSTVDLLLRDLEQSMAPTLEKLIEGYKIGSGTTNLPLGFVLERIRALEARTPMATQTGIPNVSQFGTSMMAGNHIQPDTSIDVEHSVSKLTAEIKLLHDQYGSMDDKLNSNSVQVDDMVFGSRVDTEKWVRQHVPGHEPDGFHDIMTILTLVSEPNISFKDGMDEAYLSSKVGFNSSSSARNAHSFKCELPDIFGKMVAGSDRGFPLPAVKTAKIWNPNDGVSGVKRTTTQSLRFQVENIKMMLTHFYGTTKAYTLAFTLLTKSQAFWISLANWIDEFLLKLTIVSCCSADEAWLLVAACVRGVFRELRRVRIVAQEAEKLPDKATSCGLFLWGSLQAHRIMDEFTVSAFEGHACITPIINMHLFQHRVPLSLHNTLKSKVLALEKMVGDQKKELDRLKTATTKKSNSRDSTS